jgi:release factor glutamine methyltransferase
MLPPLLELVTRSADYLAKHGITNARREAEWIFAEALKLSRIELYTRFDMPLDEAEVARLRALITRRGKREPLAYVIGNQPFRALTLTVGPGVLVPRPETEELIDHVLKALAAAGHPAEARVLDIGTGSGAIALALKSECPALTVEATEVSGDAFVIARANAQRLGLEIVFHQGHLARECAGPYDAVVANLPYIGTDERADCDPELAFEPQGALFSGSDGLDLIRELMADLPRLLAPGGSAWLEHGWKQGPAIIALAAQHGLTCAIIQDGAGRDRFARIARS